MCYDSCVAYPYYVKWYGKAGKRQALVAQGIEQWFPVPRVGGSNPSKCAFFVAEIILDEDKTFAPATGGGKRSGDSRPGRR